MLLLTLYFERDLLRVCVCVLEYYCSVKFSLLSLRHYQLPLYLAVAGMKKQNPAFVLLEYITNRQILNVLILWILTIL